MFKRFSFIVCTFGLLLAGCTSGGAARPAEAQSAHTVLKLIQDCGYDCEARGRNMLVGKKTVDGNRFEVAADRASEISTGLSLSVSAVHPVDESAWSVVVEDTGILLGQSEVLSEAKQNATHEKGTASGTAEGPMCFVHYMKDSFHEGFVLTVHDFRNTLSVKDLLPAVP